MKHEGLQDVTAIVEDILVYGRTKEEHDANLHAMLERERERNKAEYGAKGECQR